jgi:hypothetical protein
VGAVLFVSYRRGDGPEVTSLVDTIERCGFQSIASLRHLLLLAQDEARAEVASRNANGTWTSRFVEGLDGVLDLPALELSLPMRELYEDVEPEPTVAQNV